MRFRQRPVAIPLLLVAFAPALLHAASQGHVADLADGKPGRDTIEPPLPTASPDKSASSIGKKDAPVDGKDGRPHQGPFIETEAERDRKKALESGKGKGSGEEKGSASDKLLKEGWDDKAKGSDLPAELPKSNDGVMDDRNRFTPKEGTRGTEGGISEKSRDKLKESDDSTAEKTPEEPKAVPPLPSSEQEKLSGEGSKSSKSGSPTKEDSAKASSSSEEERDKIKSDADEAELGGLTKPDDLPEKPHNIPHPLPDSAAKDSLDIKPPSSPSTAHAKDADAPSLIQPLHSFLLALTMIIFSEIGDKTFLVAALMAMKHPPMLVLSAAFAALAIMTLLSAVLGHAVPALLPARFVALAAALLFLAFGAKMLREGLAMSQRDDSIDSEMREVELELEEKEQLARRLGRRRSSITPYMLESGGGGARKARSNSRLPAPLASPPSSPDGSRSPSPAARGAGLRGMLGGVHNLFSLLLSPAWVQTFVMTFLGEWGDRSQIATIAMSTGADYWWVAAGGLVGHCLCTCIAVAGGRAIAGRVSLRVVTLGGAVCFLVFGVIYLVEAMYYR